MVPTDKEERGEDEEGDPHSPGGREFEHGVGKCGEVRSCAGGVHAEIKGRGDQGGMDEEGGARAEGARGGLVFGRRGARMGEERGGCTGYDEEGVELSGGGIEAGEIYK